MIKIVQSEEKEEHTKNGSPKSKKRNSFYQVFSEWDRKYATPAQMKKGKQAFDFTN